ncbi:MAG TPA: hypothetical protein VJK07_00510 [Candidatus Nanoarchaeia archaeon]|nr:hypothetical protein [Candidatus Nanoarchaeia archaeon]
MKSWVRWAVIGLALVVLVFFAIRSFSSDRAFSDNSLSNKTTTTPREDIDTVFNSEDGNVLDSAGAGSGDLSDGRAAHYCRDESRGVETCEDIDEPVCGWYDLSRVECAPDDPCVRSVFPNACEACQNDNIEYWTEGDCPLHNN